jgi:hypothetical protein
MNKPPRFVRMGPDGPAMKIWSGGETPDYWRHAGAWNISSILFMGVLLSHADERDDDFWCKKDLIGIPLIEIAEEEWRKDNEGYV